MGSLKTAEEYCKHYARDWEIENPFAEATYFLKPSDVDKIIRDYKQSIIGFIDEALKENWSDFFKEPNSLGLQRILTELKQKVEAL